MPACLIWGASFTYLRTMFWLTLYYFGNCKVIRYLRQKVHAIPGLKPLTIKTRLV
nr:MAG TPA: hypothetical protein [Bacteriophage sp.]